MRIGILTLSASDNCGSLLQCFALKKILEKYGIVDVINFSSKKSHAMYDVSYSERILSKLLCDRQSEKILTGKKGYEKFRKEHLNIRGREFFAKDLAQISNKYDIIVVGSDQVWNVQMGDFDESFFLGWTKKPKIAYAPSLGGNSLSSSKNYDMIKKMLAEFAFLSVREETGKESLKSATGRDIPKLLDPTLVVEKKLWDDLAGNNPIVPGKYIFFYSWAYSETSTLEIVAKESKRLGMPTYVIDPRKWKNRNPQKYGFDLMEESGPIIFLNLMKYAYRVYVESFHGMVFAYLFKKDFWLLDIYQKFSDLDSRLLEFVRLLGACDRLLTPFNAHIVDQSSPIAYTTNTILDAMRIKSLQYLEHAIYGVNK